MEIRIIGKHLNVTDILKEHVEAKLQKLDKYSQKIVEVQVVLKKEKYLYIVEITVIGKNLKVYSEGRSEDNFFNAFDTVQEKVLIQLKKKQEKMKDHKFRMREERIGGKSGELPEFSLCSEGKEQKGKIVRDKESSKLKTLSTEDARLLLDTTEKAFMVFRDSASGKINILYRRNDGNFGLIQPE